ncbi:MAG: M23 family metallopeptidase [Spirochaetota bacterium]|nr:MAG: M23 family metallopeptidase [Spirochaetota bacterium]
MQLNARRLISILLPLYFIISQSAVSAEYRVMDMNGDVSVIMDGKGKRQLEMNDEIGSGDIVRTKRDSYLILKATHLYYRLYPYTAVKIGTEPMLIWGKLGRSEDERFLDIRFFFIPRPAQGRTMKVVVQSHRGEITIDSGIEDGKGYYRVLEFYPYEKNTYRAFTGFDIEAAIEKYNLHINIHKDDDHTSIVYPFYLRDVKYGAGRVNIEAAKRSLFAPSERKKNEWDVLREILHNPSSESMWNGVFNYPVVEPVIISNFGRKRVYFIDKTRGSSRFHRGVDFRGETGDPVLAPNNGKVVFADERVTTGNTLVLDHGQGIYSLFYHLDSIVVNEGTIVNKGLKIAEIGATGIAAGSHLHWSIYVNGVWVNPIDWVEINF